MITFIIAPVDRPQIAAPKPPATVPPRLDWLDERLLEHLRDAGTCPTWTLLDIVADEASPRDRTAGRLLRLELFGRLKRLRALGLAFSFGRNWISATKPAPETWRPAVKRRRRSVKRVRSNPAVSVGKVSVPQEAGYEAQKVHFQMDRVPPTSSPRPVDAEQTESGNDSQRVSEAARQLSTLSRQAVRRLSGWISDEVRSFRNMQVALPGGRRVFVFGVLRGRLVFTSVPDGHVGDTGGVGTSWGVVRADQVQIVKNEHAVILGKRKSGVKEKFSPRKAEVARRNCYLPPRPGSRPRGRPRRSSLG